MRCDRPCGHCAGLRVRNHGTGRPSRGGRRVIPGQWRRIGDLNPGGWLHPTALAVRCHTSCLLSPIVTDIWSRTAHCACVGRGDSYGDNPRKLLPLPTTAHTASHLPVCSDGKRCAGVIEELVMRRPPVRIREAAPRSDGLSPLPAGAGGDICGHISRDSRPARRPRTARGPSPARRPGSPETRCGRNRA